ncbi:MAG: GHMP kinase [Acidobacteria bacterium]|nr:MAG: GHMP kinase [Acidobacteriota bacterium]
MLIRKQAFARAGLLGNPSDGYNGKTISVSVRNFRAEVVLYEWDSVEIVLAENDRARFRSVYDLTRDVRLHGYYGGIRLIKATIKRFVEHCQSRGVVLHDRNFSVRYQTDIPQQVGLAGSSAIIVATLRCLMEFYGVEIPIEAQPTFVLQVEQGELGISAGLQDRVVQVYEGVVYMDFDRARERVVDGLPTYAYERLDAACLPPLYLAYHNALSEPTEVFHNNIRERFNQGDEKVVGAMRHFASLAGWGREALRSGDHARLALLIDENFDTRRGIYNLPRWQIQMVEAARACGASAKFAGSGGAIVGTYAGEEMFDEISRRLAALEARTIKPLVAP